MLSLISNELLREVEIQRKGRSRASQGLCHSSRERNNYWLEGSENEIYLGLELGGCIEEEISLLKHF